MTTTALSELFKAIKDQQNCQSTIQPHVKDIKSTTANFRGGYGPAVNEWAPGNIHFSALPMGEPERAHPPIHVYVNVQNEIVTDLPVQGHGVIVPPTTLCTSNIQPGLFFGELVRENRNNDYSKDRSKDTGVEKQIRSCSTCGLNLADKSWIHKQGQSNIGNKFSSADRDCPVPDNVRLAWKAVLREGDNLHFRGRKNRPSKLIRLHEHPFVELRNVLTGNTDTTTLHVACIVCGRILDVSNINDAEIFTLNYKGYCSQIVIMTP